MAFKTNLHRSYQTSKALEEKGIEVPLGDGIFIKIRSFKSEKVQEAHRRLMEPYKHLARRNKALSEKDAREVTLRLMAGTVIVGWHGIVSEDGEEIPYTPENAYDLLVELPHVADVLAGQASDISLFQDELDEESVGNSEST